MKPTTTAFLKWWNAKSGLFTRMCATEPDETFTHGDVVLAHFFLIVFLLVLLLASALEGMGGVL